MTEGRLAAESVTSELRSFSFSMSKLMFYTRTIYCFCSFLFTNLELKFLLLEVIAVCFVSYMKKPENLV